MKVDVQSGAVVSERPAWRDQRFDLDHAETLASSAGISRRLAAILQRRGVGEPREIERFLQPKLKELMEPTEISHLDRAARFLIEQAKQRGSVILFGDYDVDGVTSVVLVREILKHFGIKVEVFVPDRYEDGYGLSEGAVEKALKLVESPGLFCALDCGTNSSGCLKKLIEEGYQVLVIDHHQGTESLDFPSEAVVVNPHLTEPEGHPSRYLCTAGLVFKVIQRIYRLVSEEAPEDLPEVPLKDFLDLVALGTISDLVPLVGENRILARFGLRRLRRTLRPGLIALMRECAISMDAPIQSEDVAFRMGPRLNAAGRLSSAQESLDLLTSRDQRQSYSVAKRLSQLNSERQGVEQTVLLEAEAQAENYPIDGAGLVLSGEHWHHGVVGIVAGRLARKYHRPCLVLGGVNGSFKGSGRSVPGVDLVATLSQCEEFLAEWGGHPMAVGLSVDPECLDGFRTAFSGAIQAHCGGSSPKPELTIDAWLDPSDLTSALLEELEALQPYGQGNPEPIFGLAKVRLSGSPKVVGRNHLSFSIKGETGPIRCIYWGGASRPFPQREPLDFVVKAKASYWKGRRSLQLELQDWRPSRKGV